MKIRKVKNENERKKKEKKAHKTKVSEKKKRSENKGEKREKEPDIVDEINSLSNDETKEKIKALEREIEEQRQTLLQTEIELSKRDLSGRTESKEQKNLSKREKRELSGLKKEEKKRKKLLKKKESKLSKLKQQWNLVKPYVPLVWRTLKKLLKKIRFYNTEIDIMLGNEDPYKAALNYGYFNTAFYQTLAFLCMVFSVKIKTCDINTEFIIKRFELKVSGDIYVRVSTVLAIVICFFAKILKIYLSQKSKKSKHKF